MCCSLHLQYKNLTMNFWQIGLLQDCRKIDRDCPPQRVGLHV